MIDIVFFIQNIPQFEGVPQGRVLTTTLFLSAVKGLVSALPPGIRHLCMQMI